MSGSISSELSYEGSLRQPSRQGATPSDPDEHAPPQAAEQPPDVSSPHASEPVSDPQPDNRLSVVSAVSLEPRRRSRHHHSRHSHVHRELAHMLSISSRDTKELRRGLNTAFEKLDQSRQRASHAEKLALEMVLRVNQAEDERANAMRHASTVREELGKYKALLDNAHGEIRRAQQMLEDQEQVRYEAEASAARARDNARQMKQKRLIELAREQGRKLGYNEGIQAGQRIGYNESQSPLDDERFYPNDGPRFREIFESQHRLEEFDQSPPFRDVYLNPSSPHNAEVPLPTPLPTRQVYPRLQTQFGEPLRQSNGASNQPPEPPYIPISPSRGVQRAASTDSSSTTTLPAVPTPQPVSSRAPPPMPTIPEVESTDVGSTPRRSRSLRDSPSTQNQAHRASNGTSVLSPVIPFSQGSAAFEPPPGIVEDPTSGPINGYPPESGSPIYEAPSPRRAFDDHSILTNGIIPDVSRSPVRENFSSTIGAIQSPAQEYFEIIPGDIPSPAREHFTTTHSPRAARTHIDGVRPVDSRQNPEFWERPSNRSSTQWDNGPPKRYPIPQMPAPLAPQPSMNTPYAHPSYSTGPRRRPSESDNRMPRDTRLPVNTTPDATSNRHQPPSQVMPISVERRTDTMPEQRIHAMPARTSSGQRPDLSANHGSRRTTTPPFFPGDYPVDRTVESQNHRRSAAYDQPHTTTPPLFPGDYPADQLVEPQNHRRSATYDPPHATAPPFFNGNPSTVQPMGHQNLRRSATQDPQLMTAPPFFAGGRPASQSMDTQDHRPSSTRDQRPTTDPPYSTGDPGPTTGRPMEPENHRPRVQVHIPPSRYYSPNSASPRTATPLAAQQSHVPPADMYSPYATSSNPNISASNIADQSPRRYPPTLYNEPNLQRQPTPGVDHEQEGRGSPPGLLVPSRDTRPTSPSTVLHRTGSLNGNPYAAGQRTTFTSPHNDTPTETLPVRPPSVSPRPSPAGFAQQISPPHGSMTPRRGASPNPLPRGTSPVPLPRASSPAPLPIRSPSVRSARIHRNASDVSLPGGRGSPYMHYNPELEADIAVLASSSADRLREAKR